MSTRIITDHIVNGLNEVITITADGPGPGGASHRYDVIGKAENIPGMGPRPFGANLRFQNGPIGRNPDGTTRLQDLNGITNEALLAVLIDRMRGFQFERNPDGSFDESKRGKFACKENACALTHMEEALMWLHKRTRDRMRRGVEGTMSK